MRFVMVMTIRIFNFLLAASFIFSIFCCLNNSYANTVESNAPKALTHSKSGFLIKNSSLHQQASFQSKVIGEVAAKQAVKIQQRQRAWYRIVTEPELVGWTSMLNVRFNVVTKREGELGVKSLLESMNKSAMPTQSTGIRGFDEEELKKAKPNYQQLEQIKKFAIEKEQVAQFAQQGQLKTNINIEVQP
jgi:DNA polymerase III epsilon subunit-like protein